MIKLEKIQLNFHGKNMLFHHLSCTIPTGARVALIGQNGVGKSTILRILSGALKPQSGHIIYNGTDITQQSLQTRALYIGQLLQNPLHGCIPALTVEQNCALANMKHITARFRPQTSNLPLERIDNLAKHLDIDLKPLWHQPMKYLSGGQQQMIGFIMMALGNPSIVLLDEPTAALNPLTAYRLMEAAREFIEKQGITALCVTHDHGLAKSFATETWELLPSHEFDFSPNSVRI